MFEVSNEISWRKRSHEEELDLNLYAIESRLFKIHLSKKNFHHWWNDWLNLSKFMLSKLVLNVTMITMNSDIDLFEIIYQYYVFDTIKRLVQLFGIYNRYFIYNS